MGNPLKWLDTIGDGVKILQQGVSIMDGAKKIANESPEVKAMFIEKALNDKEKLGVHFEREGAVVVGKMNGTQANNLINAYSQLTETEKEKLFGGKVNLELELQRDRTQPDGPVVGATFKVDAKKIDDWTRFSQALDYFSGKEGGASAIKAAVTTGKVEEVRKALGTKAPEGTAPEVPGASAPAASAPAPEAAPKKKNPWDKLKDMIPKGPATGTQPGSEGPQSRADQPIDVAALTAQLGLKAPSAASQETDSPTAPSAGGARPRSTDRGVA